MENPSDCLSYQRIQNVQAISREPGKYEYHYWYLMEFAGNDPIHARNLFGHRNEEDRTPPSLETGEKVESKPF